MLTMTITARTRIEHPVIDFLMLADNDGNEFALNWEESARDVDDGIYTGGFSGLCLDEEEIDDILFMKDLNIATVSIYDEDTPHKCGAPVPANDFYITSLVITDEEGNTMTMPAQDDDIVPVGNYEFTD